MSFESDTSSLSDKLNECQQVLQYQFENLQLLQQCLTHASISVTRLSSNERLEFLGDAVLGMTVCEVLFKQFPTATEGELTRWKSSLVSRNTCARLAKKLQLEQFLIMGKGLGGHRELPMSVRAALFEAVVAGIYLDGGLEVCQQFLTRALTEEIDRLTASAYGGNYKSQLQQFCQRHWAETPVYRLLDEQGPDHSKCFEISAVIGSRTFPSAWGPSKKEAEQKAAQNALQELQTEYAASLGEPIEEEE